MKQTKKKVRLFCKTTKNLRNKKIYKKTYYFSVTSTWSENVSDCKSTTKNFKFKLNACIGSIKYCGDLCAFWKMCFDDESANKNENFALFFRFLTNDIYNQSFVFILISSWINSRNYYYSIEAELKLWAFTAFYGFHVFGANVMTNHKPKCTRSYKSCIWRVCSIDFSSPHCGISLQLLRFVQLVSSTTFQSSRYHSTCSPHQNFRWTSFLLICHFCRVSTTNVLVLAFDNMVTTKFQRENL